MPAALRGTVVRWRFTDRSDGDLSPAAEPSGLSRRRAVVADSPWTWLRQIHGAAVVTVRRPGGLAGHGADAAVTDVPGAVLAVTTADCAAVLFEGEIVGGEQLQSRPVVGAAHAGWRGLEAGVLGATVEALRALGADRLRHRLGPCICAAHYEFGVEDLDRLERRLGPSVRGRTESGEPALDLRAGVLAELARLGVVAAPDSPPDSCTAGDPQRYWSWRARRDEARQAAVTWIGAGEAR